MTIGSIFDTSHEVEIIDSKSRLAYDVYEFVRERIELDSPKVEMRDDPLWSGLRGLETEFWLDTGDLDAIQPLWNRHFGGLTTNNTLLNHEVPKRNLRRLDSQGGQGAGGTRSRPPRA